eukprot:TRINITY_DN51100_c0_g1_i1.p2 TRINITY_DN51100_c0_g1~~TRINITY_DN51100_c0_g1_i1.p2  ORF type:complete len:152 (+),score=9.04 TRINITY_DN51100_c0_g1_i1:250-705(+)
MHDFITEKQQQQSQQNEEDCVIISETKKQQQSEQKQKQQSSQKQFIKRGNRDLLDAPSGYAKCPICMSLFPVKIVAAHASSCQPTNFVRNTRRKIVDKQQGKFCNFEWCFKTSHCKKRATIQWMANQSDSELCSLKKLTKRTFFSFFSKQR